MALIRPFRALRPEASRAQEVAAVPYDVVNREEAAELARGNPLSFLHVSRPEIDLPATTDPYSSEVYEQARNALKNLISAAPLVIENAPSLYIYRLQRGSQIQTGVAACYSVDEYDHDLIKKHERTRKDKEDDRTKHLLSIQAQTGPVFLTYRGQSAINDLINTETRGTPLFRFTAADGVIHTLWKATKTDELVALFGKVPALYIADGHHRAASAARARQHLRSENPGHTGQEEYNFFLAVAFPAEELRILPYYRTVKDIGNWTEAQFLEKVAENFDLVAQAEKDPRKGTFAMYFQGRWTGLVPKRLPKAGSAIASLDVSILQDQLISPILGIEDLRTDKRIDFVGGIRGTDELERLVRKGEAKVAFSLHPTTLEDLMRISDAGEIMPPKSTWFEPKLRDGLLSHLI